MAVSGGGARHKITATVSPQPYNEDFCVVVSAPAKTLKKQQPCTANKLSSDQAETLLGKSPL